MPGRLEFALPLGKARAADKIPRTDQPMRLLLLGDFSGRADASALAQRPTLRVDLDTVEALMPRIAPRITLTLAGQPCLFEPRSLDDFHPDQLLKALPPLARANDLRHRLKNAATFAQAAAELGPPATLSAASDTAPDTAAAPSSDADLLSSLLGGKIASAPTPATRAQPSPTGLDALLQRVVAPHVQPAAPQHQSAYVAAAEASLAEQLRAVLHDPGFQRLEAVWRGVYWLLSDLEVDASLELHLFDLRREEIGADIVAAEGQMARSGLHAALVDRPRGQPDAQGWSALMVLDDFGPGDADIALLAAVGMLASQAGAPAFVAAQAGLLGWQTFADANGTQAAPAAAWQQLRRSEVGPWLSAVAPRLLMRAPYGKKSDPIDTFAFEELAGVEESAALLWAPGSLAPAALIGRAFNNSGWDFEVGDERELGDLPAVIVERRGERELVPCAEHLLGERAIDALLAGGFCPLASHKDRHAVTAVRLQSIADPAAPIAGLSD